MDLKPKVNNFEYQLSGGKAGKDITLTGDKFKNYLNNTLLKNEFVVTIVEFSTMNAQMCENEKNVTGTD